MLDIDGKSYCKAKIKAYVDNNGDIKYTIGLKCKDYSVLYANNDKMLWQT